MAGNARFHNKLHRKDHHTNPTVGFPDSGTDPIASPTEPFQGDFIINGSLSCTGFQVNSAEFSGNVICENLTVRDTTLCNFISGNNTETIISDGALTGFGDFTMTMDFRQGVYAKTPRFNITGILSCDGSSNVGTNIQVGGNSTVIGNSTINGNLLIYGNLSALGDVCVINSTLATTSALSVYNAGASAALNVTQIGSVYPVAVFTNNTTKILEISSTGINVTGNGIFTGSINAPNINILQSVSSNWNSAYNNLTAQSSNWSNTFTSVNPNSANWNIAYNSINLNSTNWGNTYTSVKDTSANWNNVFTSVNSTSANWNNTYTFVNTNSSNLSNLSNVYNTVSSNSANWNNTYTTISTSSANWESTRTTVNDNRGKWLSGATDLDFVANNVNVTNSLCANIIRVFQAMHVSTSALTIAPGTLALNVNSPSYYFVTVNATGTLNMNLPSTNTNNVGMMFYIKNVSTQANRIVVINNSAGSPIGLGSSLAGNANAYTQVVWDGTTWQTTIHV